MKASELDKMSYGQMLKKFNELEKEIDFLKDERRKFRDFVSKELRTQFQNMIESKYTPANVLSQRIISLLQDVERFYIW